MRKGGKLVGEIKGEDRQWWSDERGEMKEESRFCDLNFGHFSQQAVCNIFVFYTFGKD